MRQALEILTVTAPAQGLFEITNRADSWLANHAVRVGLLTLFCRHTSASLLIQENAAPAARRDLERYFAGIAPERAGYEHDDEGPDDMPAHLRSALTNSHLTVPISAGRMLLGTWQGIYLFEHRSEPTARQLVLHVLGE